MIYPVDCRDAASEEDCQLRANLHRLAWRTMKVINTEQFKGGLNLENKNLKGLGD